MADKAKKVGAVTHYYTAIKVGIIKLDSKIKIDDQVRFEGHTTNFEQKVSDMQFEREDIKTGKKGQEVGIKVAKKVREGDKVYLVE